MLYLNSQVKYFQNYFMGITLDQLNSALRIYSFKNIDPEILNCLLKVLNHSEKSVFIDDIEINHTPLEMEHLLKLVNLSLDKDSKLIRNIEDIFSEGVYSDKFILWQHQMAGYFELSKLGNGDSWVLDLFSEKGDIHWWSHDIKDIYSYNVMTLTQYVDFLENRIPLNFKTKIDINADNQNSIYRVTNMVGEALFDSDNPKEALKQLEKDGYAKRYPQVFIDTYLYLKDIKSVERIQNLPLTNEPFVGFSMGKGVIVFKDKVLLKKTPNKYRKMYEFLGARIIDDESMLDAIKRYMKTTFSVDIINADKICEYFEDPKFLVEYFYLTLEPIELRIQELEFEWVDINQLEKTDIMPHGINISVSKYLRDHK